MAKSLENEQYSKQKTLQFSVVLILNRWYRVWQSNCASGTAYVTFHHGSSEHVYSDKEVMSVNRSVGFYYSQHMGSIFSQAGDTLQHPFELQP